jgi:predicted phosphodiesterase
VEGGPAAVRDLGAIAAPLLVFGGPYGNLEATWAVLRAAEALGIPPERTLCTGDVAAYCGDPRATAERLRRAGVHVVRGNCEEALARGAADCGCGFRRGGGCDALAADWYAHAARHVSPDIRRWMGSLPRTIRFQLNGVRIACVHGSVSSINRFIFASTPAGEKLAEIALAEADGVIGGHCGLPFTQLFGGAFWHNAGAAGLPANDGTPRVWYSLLRPEGAGIAIEHRALGYDHARAAAKMRAHGLPEGYAAALASGLWPSGDVLPPEELAATGQPLDLDGAVIRFEPGGWRADCEQGQLRPPPLLENMP